MFELAIVCVIFLALAYGAVLWVMGRREDVLHGEFVEGDLQADEPVRSVFPPKPAPVRFPEQPARTALPKAALPEQPAFRQERLESLLKSIKQDLNQLVRK
jgi:hypothetical protein